MKPSFICFTACLAIPVVPGWITPTLPLTIVFLEGFPMGKERIQAMIALQMLVGLVFIFMGVTRLADKFVHAVPNSVKADFFCCACYSYGRAAGRERKYAQYPLAIVAGVGLVILISFHENIMEKRKTKSFLILLRGTEIFSPILSQLVVGLWLANWMRQGMEIG